MEPRDLYGLPFDRFVAERSALAKALRSEGDRDAAAKVAKLRKPSIAAWAVNQLVRTQRRAVADLFDSGDQLQGAQGDLVAGRGDPSTLRAAAERERGAVGHLIDAARGLLTSQGHELAAPMLDRVRDTLHAAALDPDARAQVADACLERELRHVGIGDSGAPGLSAKRGTANSSGVRSRRARPRDARRPSSQKQAKHERTERLKAARRAAADAQRTAERAAAERQAAQQRRDRAAVALEDAEAALATAHQRAEQTELASRRAQQALTDDQRTA